MHVCMHHTCKTFMNIIIYKMTLSNVDDVNDTITCHNKSAKKQVWLKMLKIA